MRNKIKIALVVAETAPVPDVLGGGAERLVTMLIDQNEVENRVKFIVTSKYNTRAKELATGYENTSFVFLKNKKPFDKICNALSQSMNKLFGKNYRKHGYYNVIAKKIDSDCDVLIDQNGYCKEVGFLCERFGTDRILAHIHWQVNPIDRGIDSFYGGVIGVSNYITDYWIQHSNRSKIEGMTVYSAVDQTRFSKKLSTDNILEYRQKYHINPEDFVYIYCGRLHEQKGARELIKAYMNLNLTDSKLLIVGGSHLKNASICKYEAELHAIASTNKNIVFTGYIDNENLLPLYSLSNVQVIPTLVEEAAGLVAIEGLYSGLPIIATKSGGLPEYLDDNCSIIVEKDYNLVDNLTDAMRNLYSDREMTQKMSMAARKRAEKFTQKKYYDDFIDCIEEYIRKKEI